MTNNRSLLPVCVLCASLPFAIFRIIQLHRLTAQGTVSPTWLSVVTYVFILAIAAAVFIGVKRSSLAQGKPDVTSPLALYPLPLLGISLILESAAVYFDGLTYLGDNATIVCHGIAGICILVSFLLYRFFGKRVRAIYLTAFFALVIAFVFQTIHVFISNSTTLAFTLNIISLLILCAILFFFKALVKEYDGCADASSRISLFRSGLMLIFLVPGEIAGHLCFRFFTDSSNFATGPVRGDIVHLITAATVFVLAAGVIFFSVPCPAEEETGGSADNTESDSAVNTDTAE